MVQSIGNNTIMPVEMGHDMAPPPPLNKDGQYIFKENYLGMTPPPVCAKDNPPCPFMPQRIQFKVGEAVNGKVIGDDVMTYPMGIIVPGSVLVVNPSTASKSGGETGARPQAKDPWTGGIDWSNVFNFRNLFWTVVVVVLIYLFLKHMLPLIKTSLKKP